MKKVKLLVFALTISSCMEGKKTFKYTGSNQPVQAGKDLDAQVGPELKFEFSAGAELEMEEDYRFSNTITEQPITLKANLLNLMAGFTQEVRRRIDEDPMPTREQKKVSKMVINSGDSLVINLDEMPVPDSVSLSMDEKSITEFTLETSRITIADNSISDGDVIDLLYTASRTEYQLAAEPALGSLLVKLDEETLNPDYYSVSGQTLTLTNPLNSNSMLSISYDQAAVLKKEISLGENVIPDSIRVSYDDISIDNSLYLYSSETTKLEMDPPPPEGAMVRIDYTMKLGNQYRYNLAKDPLSVLSIELIDMDTAEELSFSTSRQVITIQESDFVQGRNLMIRYKTEEDVLQSLKLSKPPLEGTFESDFNRERCYQGQGIKQERQNVTIDCETPESLSVKFTYRYFHKLSRIPVPTISSQDAEIGIWSVYYDGVKSHDWTREGNIIRIAEGIAADTKVTISFSPPASTK